MSAAKTRPHPINGMIIPSMMNFVVNPLTETFASIKVETTKSTRQVANTMLATLLRNAQVLEVVPGQTIFPT
jgi:hypothetical protein